MKVYNEKNLEGFNPWCGAIDTKNKIMQENKSEEFDSLIEDIYPNGLSDTQLNDILWFEDEWIYEALEIE